MDWGLMRNDDGPLVFTEKRPVLMSGKPVLNAAL